VACDKCDASFTRCASPPESVVADWPQPQVPPEKKPTSARTLSFVGQPGRTREEGNRLLHGELQQLREYSGVIFHVPETLLLEAVPLQSSQISSIIAKELHLDRDRAIDPLTIVFAGRALEC